MKTWAHMWMVGALSCWPVGNAVATPMDERAALRHLCKSGVDAAVAQARRAQGSSAVVAARVLPNPSLILQHQAAFSGDTEEETVLGISVPISISGRRGLNQDAAKARSLQASAEARATLFEAAVDFREAYARAALDQARASVLTEQQQRLDALSDMIRGLVGGGETAGYDLLRQETQADLHRREVEAARARAAGSFARLEAWTGEETGVDAVTLSDFLPDEPHKLEGAADHLGRSTSSGASPLVKALEAQALAGGVEAQAAGRRSIPDVDLFAGYRRTSLGAAVGHGIALGVTLPLTFFDRGQGEAARANSEAGVALTMAQRLRQQHQVQLKVARQTSATLQRSYEASRKTSQNAAILQDKARQLYASGEVTITELLETYRDSEQARLATLAIAEQLAQTRFSAMRALGTLFDPSLDRDCNSEGAQR